jgi:hypothetical protein
MILMVLTSYKAGRRSNDGSKTSRDLPMPSLGSKVLQDTLVPLMASRGVEMILGILGIMRTGSGFLDDPIWATVS